ncbi:MAG: AtpZ/AtpI family protein [Acetobacteraceae bacterium]|nr:AtpZ/AtpI family protein [Acetobacteraceae bacterium]MBV8526205.1 AtpZ/AtpI family protein [Acetobacteraceae bacterium]MBV8589187.1 AtpZ/AtpI family protein [Acetobacteraceae bacterium]
MSEERGTSFHERLRAARDKRGLDAKPQPSGAELGGIGGTALGIGLRVGMELVSAMVVAVVIGWALDKLFHTTPILMAVFVLLGGAAGVLNVYRAFAPPRR